MSKQKSTQKRHKQYNYVISCKMPTNQRKLRLNVPVTLDSKISNWDEFERLNDIIMNRLLNTDIFNDSEKAWLEENNIVPFITNIMLLGD